MRKKIVFSVISLLALNLAITPVSAAEFGGGQSYILNKNQTVRNNLYAAGSNVIINGNVNRDLMAAGGTVTISGDIGQDAIITGGTVNILGHVGDDLRLAGGELLLDNSINGDTLTVGGQIQAGKNAALNGDTFIAGGNVVIDGTLNGRTKISGGRVRINGRVSSETTIEAKQELVFGESAVVNGQINYKAPKPATVESGAQINAELNYTPIQGQQKDWNKGAWGLTVGWFIKLAGLILAGLLALWLFKRRSQEIVEHVIDDFGKNLLFGFIGLIVIPIAVILAFATVIGIIPAILTLLLYIVFLIIAGVFSGLIAGALIFKWVFKYKSLLNWKTVVAGIIVLQLITIIPVLGWLVMFILFLAAFGAILTLFYKRFLNR